MSNMIATQAVVPEYGVLAPTYKSKNQVCWYECVLAVCRRSQAGPETVMATHRSQDGGFRFHEKTA